MILPFPGPYLSSGGSSRSVSTQSNAHDHWPGSLGITTTRTIPFVGVRATNGVPIISYQFYVNSRANTSMLTCNNCGANISEDINFCPECGSKLNETPAGEEGPVDEPGEARSLTLTSILAWGGGISAVGLGLLFMVVTSLGGVIMVIAGILTIPGTRRRIEGAANVKLSMGIVAAIYFIGVVGGVGIAIDQTSSTPDYNVDEVKSDAQTVDYDELLRNIEDYEGASVEYRGQVMQVIDRDGDQYILRVAVTRESFGWDDDVYISWEGERVLEEDIIRFWGVVEGPITYETVLGNERTIPEITAVDIEVE